VATRRSPEAVILSPNARGVLTSTFSDRVPPPTSEVSVPVLMWVAVLVAGWCVASVVTAVALGAYLRQRAEATDPEGALRPLDTGPLRLWLGDLPEVPATPAEMGRRGGWDGLVAGLPAPRTSQPVADRTTIS
jgi:hypothetical protein